MALLGFFCWLLGFVMISSPLDENPMVFFFFLCRD